MKRGSRKLVTDLGAEHGLLIGIRWFSRRWGRSEWPPGRDRPCGVRRSILPAKTRAARECPSLLLRVHERRRVENHHRHALVVSRAHAAGRDSGDRISAQARARCVARRARSGLSQCRRSARPLAHRPADQCDRANRRARSRGPCRDPCPPRVLGLPVSDRRTRLRRLPTPTRRLLGSGRPQEKGWLLDSRGLGGMSFVAGLGAAARCAQEVRRRQGLSGGCPGLRARRVLSSRR